MIKSTQVLVIPAEKAGQYILHPLLHPQVGSLVVPSCQIAGLVLCGVLFEANLRKKYKQVVAETPANA